LTKQHTTPSGLELLSEVSDLTAGLAILTFTLAPLALPALALTALTAVLLLIPAVRTPPGSATAKRMKARPAGDQTPPYMRVDPQK
jgi:hypothetical protein